VEHVIDGRCEPGSRLSAFGRTVRAAAYPIGIDAKAYVKASRSQGAQTSFDRVFVSAGGRKVIVGVDRLDYSKGLEDRLLGYERFLNTFPDWRRNVFLLQIAPPSRESVDEYVEMRARLEANIGRINGAFAEVDWQPVRYVNQGYARDELAGVYRAARVGLVTPLRDGMNLVAKEYVAAQRADDPGVLILSQFAGAALQMKEALVINPFSQEDLAEALDRALSMSRGERVRRWETLMHGVSTQDVTAWRDAFVHDLQSVREPA
jgi:trehalose 6-phosphate synthase